MTTSSARPEALHDHARRLRREQQLTDDALRELAVHQAAYRDRCAAGHPAGLAAGSARRSVDLMVDLASDLGSVARAFAAADAGSGVRAVDDSHVVGRLVRLAPGLTAEVGIHDGVARQQGRRFGRSLIGRSSHDVVRRLTLEGAVTTDPAFAAGLLEGIGASGLGRLAVQAQHDSHALGGTPADEARLWRQLTEVFDAAAGAVHPLAAPGATPVVDPGGLDLGLIAALGGSWAGRLALRSIAEHMAPPTTAVTAAFADELLLGESATGDLIAAGGALSVAGMREAPGTAGEARALHLLAQDPMASFRLELLHPTGPSPALLLLDRDGWAPAPDGAARSLRNVAVTAVERGWAAPWVDPVAGTGDTYGRLPVPRVLDHLIDTVIQTGAPTHASPSLSRTLAAVVATHPASFEVATAVAETAPTVDGKEEPARLYEAIARDRDALRHVTETLTDQHRKAIVASVRSRSPAATTVHAAVTDTVLTHRTVELLIEGAHAAGREHHVGVVIASVLGSAALGKALPAIGQRVAGPVGAKVGSKAAKVAKGSIADYRKDHEDTYDGREHDAQRELERGAPLAGAIAMTQDPSWAPLLRFPPGGLQPADLALLDVGASAGAQLRFEAWRQAQDDPRVTEVLDALHPRPR